jgi:hypothetical protein
MEPTKMPEWLKKQFDAAERTVDTWSDGKREAAGIPRKQKFTVSVSVDVFAESENEAKEKGLEHLYEMMSEDKNSYSPINLEIEVHKH